MNLSSCPWKPCRPSPPRSQETTGGRRHKDWLFCCHLHLGRKTWDGYSPLVDLPGTVDTLFHQEGVCAAWSWRPNAPAAAGCRARNGKAGRRARCCSASLTGPLLNCSSLKTLSFLLEGDRSLTFPPKSVGPEPSAQCPPAVLQWHNHTYPNNSLPVISNAFSCSWRWVATSHFSEVPGNLPGS